MRTFIYCVEGPFAADIQSVSGNFHLEDRCGLCYVAITDTGAEVHVATYTIRESGQYNHLAHRPYVLACTHDICISLQHIRDRSGVSTWEREIAKCNGRHALPCKSGPNFLADGHQAKVIHATCPRNGNSLFIVIYFVTFTEFFADLANHSEVFTMTFSFKHFGTKKNIGNIDTLDTRKNRNLHIFRDSLTHLGNESILEIFWNIFQRLESKWLPTVSSSMSLWFVTLYDLIWLKLGQISGEKNLPLIHYQFGIRNEFGRYF